GAIGTFIEDFETVRRKLQRGESLLGRFELAAEPALNHGIVAFNADEIAEDFVAVVKTKSASGFVRTICGDDRIETDPGNIIGPKNKGALRGGKSPGDAVFGGDVF